MAHHCTVTSGFRGEIFGSGGLGAACTSRDFSISRRPYLASRIIHDDRAAPSCKKWFQCPNEDVPQGHSGLAGVDLSLLRAANQLRRTCIVPISNVAWSSVTPLCSVPDLDLQVPRCLEAGDATSLAFCRRRVIAPLLASARQSVNVVLIVAEESPIAARAWRLVSETDAIGDEDSGKQSSISDPCLPRHHRRSI